MNRLALIATLKDGAKERAAELLAEGPPFDLAERGFSRHVVYLSGKEVVFAFEGPEADWKLDELVDDPFAPRVSGALDEWRALVEGPVRLAYEAYSWQREPSESGEGA